MTTEVPAATTAVVESTPTLPRPVRWHVLIYLGVLIVLIGFGAPGGGLIGLPISFYLKNRLHLQAHQTAIFHWSPGFQHISPSSSASPVTASIRSECATAVS